jgi:hypothetical protein
MLPPVAERPKVTSNAAMLAVPISSSPPPQATRLGDRNSMPKAAKKRPSSSLDQRRSI